MMPNIVCMGGEDGLDAKEWVEPRAKVTTGDLREWMLSIKAPVSFSATEARNQYIAHTVKAREVKRRVMKGREDGG